MVYAYLEVRHIQSHVFASRRLRGIRNGSFAVRVTEAEVAKFLRTGECVRVGGGVVVGRFDGQHRADEFLDQASRQFSTQGLDTVHATLEVHQVVDFYEDVLEKLLEKIEIQKRAPEGAELVAPTSIFAVPCEVSGVGASSALIKLGPADRKRVSSVEAGKWTLNTPDSDAEYLAAGWSGGVGHPTTMEGVAGWTTDYSTATQHAPGTSERRMVGLVFADVNGLGSLLPVIARNEVRFSEFCTGLSETLRESLKEALKATVSGPLARRSGANIGLPFRLLYFGGDDLCFAVAGPLALPCVHLLLAEFATRSRAVLQRVDGGNVPGHLSLSAGVVLAPAKFPILALQRIGRSVEKNAKAVGRLWQRHANLAVPPSLVDFHLVDDATGDIGEVRRRRRIKLDGATCEAFGGPYIVAEPSPTPFVPLEHLLQCSRLVSAFPAQSKVKQLRSIVTAGATREFDEWLGHLGEHRSEWLAMCASIGAPANALPLRPEPPGRAAILDAMQLAPILAAL